MTANHQMRHYRTLGQIWIAMLALTLLIGCGHSDVKIPGKSDGESIPKQTFHKPDTFADAVARIRTIHGALNGQEALPAAKKYDVVQVIHGQGAAAHSHYFLKEEAATALDHDDEHSEEFTHQIEVDVFTEYHDITRWLPTIAANSAMDRDTWNRVSETSEKLESIVSKSCTTDGADSKKRQTYQQDAQLIESLIVALEEAATLTTSEQDGE